MKKDCMNVSRNSRNTQYLYDLWDERYSNRGDNEQVFSGNVDEYEFKYIEQSQFIIVKNPSRTQKKVDHIKNSAQFRKQNVEKKKVILELKRQDFNFQKIHKQQILTFLNGQMQFQNVSQTFLRELNKNQPDQLSQTLQKKTVNKQIHSIIINKVPISRYHCLFVPWYKGKNIVKEGQIKRQILAQKITLQSLPLVMNLLRLYDDLIVGYNSVGSAASVNHLHFHMFFKPYLIGNYPIPIKQLLQQQKQATQKHILNTQNFSIQVFDSGLIQGLLIQIKNNLSQTDYKSIYNIFDILITRNIPHNVMLFKQNEITKMIILPRQFQQNQGIKFGCMEFMGVFCLDYQNTKFHMIEQKFMQIKIQKSQFDDLIEEIKTSFQNFYINQ